MVAMRPMMRTMMIMVRVGDDDRDCDGDYGDGNDDAHQGDDSEDAQDDCDDRGDAMMMMFDGWRQ